MGMDGDDAGAEVPTPPPGRQRARWLVAGVLGLLAAAVVGTVALGASPSTEVSAGDGEPVATDAPAPPEPSAPELRWPAPAEVAEPAAEVERALAHDEVFVPGSRISLDAERVTCAHPEGFALSGDEGAPAPQLVEAVASGRALTADVIESDLVQACTVDAGGAEVSGPVATCATGQGLVAEVTVMLDGRSCAELGDDARPVSAADLDALNHARAAEVRILAVPSPASCPSVAEATEWAEREVRDMALPLSVSAYDEGPACYRPVTYWDRGEVIVQPLGPQS
jgi:hypothetical protein